MKAHSQQRREAMSEDSPEAIATCLACHLKACQPQREECGLKKLDVVRVKTGRN